MQVCDFVLLTEDRYINPENITDYISNILADDAIVTSALENNGFKVLKKSWCDATFDWSSTRFVIVRTTWDYFDRFEEFDSWLEATSAKTTFINSMDTLRWNMDKHYLADLRSKGVNIVETYFIETGDRRSLDFIFNELELEEAVLKPVISGAARHTYRLNNDNITAHNQIFNQLISSEAMIIQPFQHEIINKGEVAFMLMGGIFTHAVLKKSKAGDFRVQDDFGGTLHDYTPSLEEIQFAEKAVAACSELPMYARVDIVHDNYGQLAVMELELIEPELWFRRQPDAAKLLVESIMKKHQLSQ
jgi:glutathione synthase/RimK-type ligase-like ATP-grasp enzyme